MRISEKIYSFYQYIKKFLDNRWIRLTGQIAILAASSLYLVLNSRNAQELLKGLTPHYNLLFLSLLLTILAVVLGAIGWGFSLRALCRDLTWTQMTSIHLGSNLAKYLPGYAWQLAGKAYLTHKEGITRNTIVSAMILEMSQLMLLGSGLALVSLPREFINNWFLAGYTFALFLIIRLAGFSLMVFTPYFLIVVLRRTSPLLGLSHVNGMAVFASSLAIWLGWIVFSAAYYLIGEALMDLPASSIVGFTFILTASFIIGLLIVIIPGSIGVRESLMVYFLSLLHIPSPIAVLIAVLSRLLVILSEVSSYLVFRYVSGRNKTFQD